MNRTTMTVIKRIIAAGSVILWTMLGPLNTRGQQKDFQTWWEFELSKGFRNGFTLSGEIGQRFRNNSLQYDRSLVTLTGEYEIADFLEISGGARALLTSSDELQLQTRYRFHIDLTGKMELSVLELDLRSRLQYGFDDLVSINDWSGNNLVNRNRLRVKHHIFGTRLDLFIFLESFHHLSDGGPKLFYRMRYAAGAVYALNFRSELGVRYILEDEFNVRDPLQAHILLFGYTRNL